MKIKKLLTASILALSIVVGSLPAFATTNEISRADEIISTSVVLCAKKPYYYKEGKKFYFDSSNKAYAPHYSNSDIYVSVLQFKNIFDVAYSYDGRTETLTLKKGDCVFKTRIGEDAAEINGDKKRLDNPVKFNGVRTILPIVETAKNMGYFVAQNEGVFIIGSAEELSEAFNSYDSLDELSYETVVSENFDAVKKVGENKYILPDFGFNFSEENDKADMGYVVSESGNALKLASVKSGYAGLKSATVPFVNQYAQYGFYFDCVKENYKGNEPLLIISYYSNKKLVEEQKYRLEETDDGGRYTYALTKDKYQNIEADSIRYTFATENTSTDFGGSITCSSMKVDCYKNIARVKSVIENKLRSLFDDSLYSNDFETPSEISFQSWGEKTVERGFSNEIYNSGTTSGYVGAINTSYAAFSFPYKYKDLASERTNVEFNIRAKVYVTEDYANNEPCSHISLSENGKWKRMVYAGADKVPVAGEWTEICFRFNQRTVYRDDLVESGPNDTFTFGVGTRVKKSGDNAVVSGRIYYDDVRFEIAECSDESTNVQIVPDNQLSWYILGDTVKYTVLDKDKHILLGFEYIEGIVRNLDRDVVYKNKITVAEFMEKGWIWKPETETGSFSVEFFGIRKDGTSSDLEHLQRYISNKKSHDTDIVEHRFVVAAKETKPASERNTFAGINSTNDIGTQFADKIGYAAVRYHYVRWGDSQLFKGIHKGVGQFDWTSTDEMADFMSKNDMILMANIFGSPKWALPKEFQGVTGGMVAGGMKYNGYGIQNQEYVKDFIDGFLERYGKVVDIIEFWNEPGGQSAFWYDHDNDHVLIEMLKTTHECVEAYNQKNGTDVKIAFAGFLRSQEAWLADFLQIDPNSESYYDYFSIHGNYNAPYRIYDYVYNETGYERKPWMNSETYPTTQYKARDKETFIPDFRLNSLSALMNYFYHIKRGAMQIYDFRAVTDISEEYGAVAEKDNNTQNFWGLGTDYGTHVEPIPLAYVLNVFFDLMGKDFKYDSEYTLSDGQVALKFISDGKPVIALWNKDTKNSILDERIVKALKSDSVVMDYEGHKITDGNYKLDGKKLYWILNADENALKAIEPTPDLVLNANNVGPYFTATTTTVKEKVPVDKLEVPKARLTKGKLFDERTFNVVNDEINWIDTDWNWVSSTYSQPDDFSAKFAASYTPEGFYLMVDVEDSIFAQNDLEGIMKNYWEYDGIQLAIDTKNTGNAADRLECAAAETVNGTFFQKGTVPDFGEQLITNYTKQGVAVEGKFVNISNTEKGKLYKIFVPRNELYPMEYPHGEDCLRFSLLVNNNNTFGRMGYLEWSTGIGATKKSSSYGALIP